jgi:hypothetical protein
MFDKKIFALLAITLLVALIPAASAASSNNASQAVTVTVKPTISISIDTPTLDFGALDADGLSTIKNTVLTSNSNVAIDVWTRALNFAPSGASALTLSDFAFSNGGAYTTYTNSYQMLFTNIPKAPKTGAAPTRTANQRITVPLGTDPGQYNSTVYYSAVVNGAAAPTLP